VTGRFVVPPNYYAAVFDFEYDGYSVQHHYTYALVQPISGGTYFYY